MNHRFEDVEVKENAISLLEDRLRRKRKKCMIGLGSMTDPYIPEELKLNYTRQALEVINKYGFGVSLITKSARVLRDLDLFQEINVKQMLHSEKVDFTEFYKCKNSPKERFIHDSATGEYVIIVLNEKNLSKQKGFRASTK